MAKHSKGAQRAVESALHRKKKGTLKSGKGGKGGTVKSREQAIAIGLSEAREKGAKVPAKKKGVTKKAAKKTATKRAPAKKSATKFKPASKSANRTTARKTATTRTSNTASKNAAPKKKAARKR